MTPLDDLARLIAIEDIKRLKARYFLCVDLQDWAGWLSDVWAPDAELFVPDYQSEPFVGAAAITTWSAEMLAGACSIHQGHMPIIDILSPVEATGIWTMEDHIHPVAAKGHGEAAPRIRGWGHYHETYVRLPEGWRIRRSRLTRLRLEYDRNAPPENVPIDSVTS